MQIAEFVDWIMRETFEGSAPDGSDIQDTALKCGILVETTYDPERHGESPTDCNPGEPYYEYSPALNAAIAAETK